jgi:hypothetical protein
MTPTHAEIFDAMSEADAALKSLLDDAVVDRRADTCRRLGLLAAALHLACIRLAEIDAAINHKGRRH